MIITDLATLFYFKCINHYREIWRFAIPTQICNFADWNERLDYKDFCSSAGRMVHDEYHRFRRAYMQRQRKELCSGLL